jgi:hypothetical protein
MSRASSLCLLLPLAFAGAGACAAADDTTDGETTADATTGELRVRVGELTLWVDRKVPVDLGPDGQLRATIHARTSRNLTQAFGWVPDDGFGTSTIVGPKSFTIELRRGHEANTMLSGLPLFVSIDVATGTPTHYDARLDLQLGLTSFSGSGALWIDAAVFPEYAGPGEDPLRYRASVETTSATLAVQNAGVPTITAATGGFTVDWTYDDIQASLLGKKRAKFVTAGGGFKSAVFEIKTVGLDMTTGDATAVWPSVCEPDVYACMQSADDLTTCGHFRDVHRCVYADPCEVNGSSPLELEELDLDFVWASQLDTYLAGCVTGGDWCSVQTLQAYMFAECLAEPATLADIVGQLLDGDQDWGGGDVFARGTVLDRSGLAGTPLFSGSYSPGGPALFEAIDAHMANGPLEAWKLTEEVPCHNCTDFRDVYVLYYPEAFRVILVEAGHGYDS